MSTNGSISADTIMIMMKIMATSRVLSGSSPYGGHSDDWADTRQQQVSETDISKFLWQDKKTDNKDSKGTPASYLLRQQRLAFGEVTTKLENRSSYYIVPFILVLDYMSASNSNKIRRSISAFPYLGPGQMFWDRAIFCYPFANVQLLLFLYYMCIEAYFLSFNV